jgi:hypothetical protein
MGNSKQIPGGTFCDEDHSYRDDTGRRVPSVTQCFQLLGMVDYGLIKAEILARKSTIGIATHLAVEYLVSGSLDWDSVAPEVLNYVVGAEQWFKEQQFQSVEQEGQGICTLPGGMAFGFAYDHRGTMMYKGRLRHTILDLKTTTQSSPTWRLQTSAYSLAAPKLPAGERYLRVILQLREDATFRPYFFEDRTDESAFQYALHTAIWGLNHGLYTLETAA